MEITKTQQDGNAILKIEGSLSIYEAADLREELLANVIGDLTLDLSEVDVCDTAGVQILVAAGKSADRAGKSFTAVGYSAGVKEAFGQVGLNCQEIFNGNKET